MVVYSESPCLEHSGRQQELGRGGRVPGQAEAMRAMHHRQQRRHLRHCGDHVRRLDYSMRSFDYSFFIIMVATPTRVFVVLKTVLIQKQKTIILTYDKNIRKYLFFILDQCSKFKIHACNVTVPVT